MSNLITIRPYTEADGEQLLANAKEDGHGVYFPTHVLIKENRIVGYLSINALPLILSWQDSKRMVATDSLRELGFIEGALAGWKTFVIPCDPDSPYYKSGFLEKAGYNLYGKPVHLFLKGG